MTLARLAAGGKAFVIVLEENNGDGWKPVTCGVCWTTERTAKRVAAAHNKMHRRTGLAGRYRAVRYIRAPEKKPTRRAGK